jgi:hypothetical protein
MTTNKDIEKEMEKERRRMGKEGVRQLGISIQYGDPDEPNLIVMSIEREDRNGFVSRQFIPEEAMQFAQDLGMKTYNDPKTAGIAIEREDGKIEMVALPPEGAMQLAENMMGMAMKARHLNEEKGFILKDEYKGKKPFVYKDVDDSKMLLKKGTFKKDRALFRKHRK